jgi:hypothetical protein
LYLASLVLQPVTAEVCPVITTSLQKIIVEVQGCVGTIVPVLLGVVGSLTEVELKLVLQIVTDVKEIVMDIQVVLKGLLSVVTKGQYLRIDMVNGYLTNLNYRCPRST